MKERKKLKEIYSQHKDAIKAAMGIIIAIMLFTSGFLISWNFMQKPLNDSQFKLCEQVVRDVYEQKGADIIVEAPEGYSIVITETTIKVGLKNKFYRGEVVAKLQNGELVFTRDMKTGGAIFVSIVMGILFVLITTVIIWISESILKKIRQRF